MRSTAPFAVSALTVQLVVIRPTTTLIVVKNNCQATLISVHEI